MPKLEVPAALRDRFESLSLRHQQLANERQHWNSETQRLLSARQSISAESDKIRTQLSTVAGSLRGDRAELKSLEDNVETLRGDIASMETTLAGLESRQAPVETLQHELPPIGRLVSGNEIHFRLSHNRVSRVPIPELVEEVQREIQRRKEILLSRSFFQGSSRPVNGYLMEYVLQRQSLSLQDQLRGGGTIRIGVTGWVIKPVGPLRDESPDEALASGSAFREALSREGPTATITFWVYPDSFEIHRKLKQFAHDAGFWVASRPLPLGVPIAGSPQGSKSLAQ